MFKKSVKTLRNIQKIANPLNILFLIPSEKIDDKIYDAITSGKDYTREHIEKYSKLKEELNNNSSKVIQANINFIQNMERKNSIYYAEINNNKYALIENNKYLNN